MKIFFSQILIFFLSLLIFSCSGDEDDGTSSELPPITSEGLYTFGCKINGQVFVPKNGDGWCLDCGPQMPLRLNYFQEGGDGQYILGIHASNNINGDVRIYLNLYLDEPLEEKVYELSESHVASIDKIKANASACIYRKISGEEINSCFVTTSDVTGTLEILEINDVERFVAGVFQFQGINQQGEIVNFTDGRFDIRMY